MLEFESPSAAIIATRVPPLSRATNLLVFLLVVSLLVASGLIQVDKIVSASGKLVADAPNILLQPFDRRHRREHRCETGRHRPQGPGAGAPQSDLQLRELTT